MNEVNRLIPEADWQATVMDYARLLGWHVTHFHDSRRERGGKLVGDADAAGWPDLVLIRGGAILFRELKTERGRLSGPQAEMLTRLRDAGQDVGVWRPRDWERVQRELE